MTTEDPRLKISAVKDRYNDPGWYKDSKDKWHNFTSRRIHEIVENTVNDRIIDSSDVIVNVGAGKHNYGLKKPVTVNIDISEKQLSLIPHAVVSNAELLPLGNASASTVICVGSVINYCDAVLAIAEFERIIKPNGFLIIDFESSQSGEYLFQSIFRQSAAVAETFFAGRPEAVWVYSFAHICRLLEAAGFVIIEHTPIHVISPWALLLSRNASLATSIAPLDRLAAKVAFLARWASNHLLVCQKQT